MNPNVVELFNAAREPGWLPWAVQYFFLIGLSVGAFALTLPGFALGHARYQKLARLALPIALVTGIAAPVALLSDLHHPGRFLGFYLHFQPQSWMAWGAWFIPVYVAGLITYAWLALRGDCAHAAAAGGSFARLHARLGRGGPAGARSLHAAASFTATGAALVMLYTGMEVMVVEARALWHTPFLPLQFAATAAAGALGAVLLANRWLGDDDRGLERELNLALAVVQCVVVGLGVGWLAMGASGLSAAHSRALHEVAALPAWQITAAWAAAAAVAPIVLALKWPAASGVATGLIALHSAWMIRWTVFIGGQSLPKMGAGASAYELPLGAEGWLGIAGTAGLVLLLYAAIDAVLPWRGQAIARRARLPAGTANAL